MNGRTNATRSPVLQFWSSRRTATRLSSASSLKIGERARHRHALLFPRPLDSGYPPLGLAAARCAPGPRAQYRCRNGLRIGLAPKLLALTSKGLEASRSWLPQPRTLLPTPPWSHPWHNARQSSASHWHHARVGRPSFVPLRFARPLLRAP
jgi:hypothetical protein